MDSLRHVLRKHLVSDVEAPGNLSIHIGTDSGSIRGFHFLYRGNASVLRTRSRARLIRATIAHLEGFQKVPESMVRLNARMLTDERSVVVIDGALGSIVQRLERRLEPLGYRYVDAGGAVIDRTTLEVVTWPPQLDFDREALAAVESKDDALDQGGAPPAAGRLPIRAVVLARGISEEHSPSRLLVRLMSLVVAPDQRTVPDDMAVAQRLLETGVVRASTNDDAELLAILGDDAAA